MSLYMNVGHFWAMDEVVDDPAARQNRRAVVHEVTSMGNVIALREQVSADIMNSMSVADYALEPDSPPHSDNPSDLADIAAEIMMSVRKVHYNAFQMNAIVERNQQWWNNEIGYRDMRAYAIRSSYHARRVYKWAEHLKSNAEIKEINQQNKVIDTEKRALVAKRDLNKGIIVALRKEIADLEIIRDKSNSGLCALSGTKDPEVAETTLCLDTLSNVDILKPHISEVKQWLVKNDVTS